MDVFIYKNYNILKHSSISHKLKKYYSMQPVVVKLFKENLLLLLLIIKHHSIKKLGNYKKPKVIQKPSSIISHHSSKIAQIINTQIKLYLLLKIYLIKILINIKIIVFHYGERKVLSFFIFNIVQLTLKIKIIKELSHRLQRQFH